MLRLRLQMSGMTGLALTTLVGLAAVGTGTLAAPPLTSWSAASAWYDGIGAGAASVAGLRLAAMVGVTWLLVGSILQLVASFTLRGGLGRLADSVSPRVLRRLAHGVAGLSVSAGLAVPALPGELAGDPPGTAVMQVVDEEQATTSTVAAPEPAATPRPVPTTATTAPAAEPTVAPALAPAEPVLTADDEVRVEPGDSFWSLAVDAVSEGGGAPPDEADVMRYWGRLIEANRDRLVDPANPDLLFPSQVLIVPDLA